MKKIETAGLVILDIVASATIATVYALTSTGVKFEFTSFRCGPVEVYVFQDGAPSFCGYLTPEQRGMLLAVSLRGEDNIYKIERAIGARQHAIGFRDLDSRKIPAEWARLFGSEPLKSIEA